MARAPGVIEPPFLDLGHIAGAAKLTSKGSRADAARAAQIAPILPAEQTLSVSSDPARDGEAAHSEESPSLEPMLEPIHRGFILRNKTQPSAYLRESVETWWTHDEDTNDYEKDEKNKTADYQHFSHYRCALY